MHALDGLDEPRRPRRRRAWPVLAKGDSRARWQISLASSRPSPASECWSRRKPWSRIGCSARSAREGGGVDRVGVGAEAERAAPAPPGRPATTHTPGLALGARLGEEQGPAVGEPPAGLTEPRLGRLLLVGLEAPALHEVDDEGDRRRSRGAGACPAGRRHERAGRTASSGAGTAVLRAVKVSGVKRSSGAPAKAASRRSAWAWISGSSGTGGREHVVDRRASVAGPARSRPAGRRRAAAVPR